MKLSKVNDVFKKYQPLIQTVGIVLILLTVGLTFYQIVLARKEYKFNEEGRQYDFNPNWRTEFARNETNALIDELVVSSLNETYNIQKIRITILDGITPYDFEGLPNRIVTGSLKNRIASIYKSHYDLQSIDCFGCFEEDSYPIAITIYFERFGERIDTTILYDYHFRTYFSKESIRYKSLGLEFIKYIKKDSSTLHKELISYNLASSFLSNIPEASFNIKVSIALKDRLYKPVVEYVYSNLSVFQYSAVLVTEDSKTRIGEFIIRMPKPLYDSLSIIQRYDIIKSINENIEEYDSTLTSLILKIQEFENGFRHVESQSHVDSIAKRGRIIGNQQQWDEWARMNYELLSLVAKRIKI